MNWYLMVVKNYLGFTGRARRTEYWMFVLINMIISVALLLIPKVGETIQGLYSLAVLLPSIAVAIRRMHDVGKSGWYCLIPIYNIVLAATAGERGSNQYGEDPMAY